MSSTQFITVEGPIGIGKTSLARAIAARSGFQLLQEIVEENPFLGRFYENIEEWSFQTEMFFLCNRYKQLADISNGYLKHDRSVVSDYNIFKNTIFAHRTLHMGELDKYLKIYDIMTADMPKATLIIHLTASVETIMGRIATRNRDFEHNMDPNYIRHLRDDYEMFLTRYRLQNPDVPVLQLDGDKLDFVKNPGDLQYIFDQIDAILSKEQRSHA
ncbi:deoxynucleoside kinase [Tumebacillus permanentifrigoris]|uniref:Deoxyguanosine kinase n=1 Tax=Tumebacillus permanentifrigoris TaxID=378543 RepID=A0A316D2L8_9BACL|nr:deoxynucleoside kinase [Tumebacillus permanentifrigoris]PWK05146.1 deoxyguanosine kinase [Tumebacillus permanentifrigoris]